MLIDDREKKHSDLLRVVCAAHHWPCMHAPGALYAYLCVYFLHPTGLLFSHSAVVIQKKMQNDVERL